MKLKMNWGTGILITFILFIASVLIQVFFYMNTDVDLVTDNYYEKELSYEDHIGRIRNTGNLEKSISVDYYDEEININFPPGYVNERISGTLLFYRPSDPSKDFVVTLQPDENCVQKISTKDLLNGYWKLKLNWDYENVSYYYEKTLLIN